MVKFFRSTLQLLFTSLLTALLTVLFLKLPFIAPDFTWIPGIASDLFVTVYVDLLRPVLSYIAALIAALFPWPIIALAAIIALARSPTAFIAIIGLMRFFRRIKLLGAEFELPEQTKRQIQGAARDLAAALAEYRAETDRDIARRVRLLELDRKLEQLAEKQLKTGLKGGALPEGFRCTIHCPDLVKAGYLYQLLDYYPHNAGRARTFSERYGIIGKVWRSELAQVVGDLLPDLQNATKDEKVSRITRDWGMTYREAQHALEKPSYACCPIYHDRDKLGVFYMDSTIVNAFSDVNDDPRVIELIKASIIALGIDKALLELRKDTANLNLTVEV